MPSELAAVALVGFGKLFAEIMGGFLSGSGEPDPKKRQARAMHAVDMLVLAALHDHEITDAEQTELAQLIAETMKAAKVEIDVPALLERWKDKRAGLDAGDFEAKVRALANFTKATDRPKVLAGVEAILKADDSDQSEALALFRDALGG